MLNPDTLKIIQDCVPALSAHGEAVTRRFYPILFEQNPELKNLFNLSNQHNGDQARALAETIFAYAKLADQPSQLLPLVNRIANKHVSLHIKPEHYPLVGKALLQAIAETLDIPMDHTIIKAWREAYTALADIFIQHEESLYLKNSQTHHGWRGFREFSIQRIEQETPQVKSFYLVPTDGQGLSHFKPGQYVGVKLTQQGPQTYDEIRQYSLSDHPLKAFYRISVKAEDNKPKGYVSNHLHDNMKVGERLLLSAPCGDFHTPVQQTRDRILISGGIGITPMMSMLKHGLSQDTEYSTTFIHCAQNPDFHCFLDETAALQAQHHFKYYCSYMDASSDTPPHGEHQGYLSAEILSRWIEHRDADVYFCGPMPFMQALRSLLLSIGFDEGQLHYETFGPSLSLAAA